MKEIILNLITNSSGSFAFIVLVLCAIPGGLYLVALGWKASERSHEEIMARIETEHRERMLKTNLEAPNKMIEAKRNQSGGG